MCSGTKGGDNEKNTSLMGSTSAYAEYKKKDSKTKRRAFYKRAVHAVHIEGKTAIRRRVEVDVEVNKSTRVGSPRATV